MRIPSGTFEMGSNDGPEDEQPVRTAEISSFSMHSREVTVAMYQRCVGRGRCTPAHYDDGKCLQWNGKRFIPVIVPEKYRGDDYPVVCVTWHQAAAYCNSVGMKLPTEAQWEYAAKAGSNARYSWGDEQPGPHNCNAVNGSGPVPVASYRPNAWGLYDMTGNVWEWTSDYYEKDRYSHSENNNPAGPNAGIYRAVRGGGWYSGPSRLRITNRHWFSPSHAEASIGFRCIR